MGDIGHFGGGRGVMGRGWVNNQKAFCCDPDESMAAQIERPQLAIWHVSQQNNATPGTEAILFNNQTASVPQQGTIIKAQEINRLPRHISHATRQIASAIISAREHENKRHPGSALAGGGMADNKNWEGANESPKTSNYQLSYRHMEHTVATTISNILRDHKLIETESGREDMQ